MKTVIYNFSGTGNSLAVAKGLAKALEGVVELLPITGCEEEQCVEIDADLLGFVFPVYFFSTPDIVRAFLKKLVFKSDPYILHISVKLDTDSGFNWTANPDLTGQLFRFKLDRSERSDGLNFLA